MFSRFSKASIALAVVLSLTTGAIVPAVGQSPLPPPPPLPPQPKAQPAPTPKPEAKAPAATKAPSAPAPSATPAATPRSTNNRPLGVDEDPGMIGKRNINKGVIAKMSGSPEKDVALGRQLANEVDRQAKFIEDPVITEYVNRVGQNVVLHSDAKVPFTIKVIDSDEANAFALPGGFFYVNKGLLLAADNEAEVAGVMAHEIAHVAARHSAENQTKGNLLQYGAIVGSIFLGGIPGLIFNNTAGLGLLAAFLRFSRGAEVEADKLAAQYLYAAGYDPNAQSTMFEKLLAQSKKKPGLISKAFSTHPQNADRMQASRGLIAKFPEREEYVISTSEFQRVKSRLMRMSNARASIVGDIASGDGTPGRPTLKRRSSSPDEAGSGTTTSESKPDERPRLKRNDGATTTTTSGTTPERE